MSRLPQLFLLSVTAVALVAGMASSEEEPATAPSFEEVWPILEKNCVVCHSSDYSESDLVLETLDTMLDGGKLHGPALVPGNSAESSMVQYMRGEKEPQMPVGSELEESEIALIVAWVDGMSVAEEGESSEEEMLLEEEQLEEETD